MHCICILLGWTSNLTQTKRQATYASTKVSFAHAEQALRDSMAVTIEDPDADGELRLVTLGMDSLGRILIVVHTPRAV